MKRIRASLYDLLQYIVGAHKGRNRLAREFDISSYESVLDLGCGNGMLLQYLRQDVAYLGLDISEARVERARRLWPAHEFRAGDVGTLAHEAASHRFHLIVASGLLHHLSDYQARTMLMQVLAVMEPGGAILLVDPVFFPGQHMFSRLLCRLDAGKWVRTQEGYKSIIPSDFRVLRQEIRDDLLYIPQSLQVMLLTAIDS